MYKQVFVLFRSSVSQLRRNWTKRHGNSATASVDIKHISNRSTKSDHQTVVGKAREFIEESAKLMKPDAIHICDGSKEEADKIIQQMINDGMLKQLKAYDNNYICRTDPRDVARVESRTWMVTSEKFDTVCHTADGVKPIMGNWMSPEQFGNEKYKRFPGCMSGRTMYVIPFSMGPVGGPISKIGLQVYQTFPCD